MPNYSKTEPTDEIKSLVEQLSQACQSLEDEELKGKLLPIIDSLKQILPLDTKPEDTAYADDMLKNKEGGGFMDKLMGGNIAPENTP